MNKLFDPTKPVQTRDGRRVTILKQDLKDAQPLVGVIHAIDEHDHDFVEQWCSDGRFSVAGKGNDFSDLVNVPAKRTYSGWQNFYKDGTVGVISSTETDAAIIRENYRKPCFACVFVTHEIEEGSGL